MANRFLSHRRMCENSSWPRGRLLQVYKILIEVYGIEPEDITEVILAGAFGNYLDKHSACAIGLIPSSLEDRVQPGRECCRHRFEGGSSLGSGV